MACFFLKGPIGCTIFPAVPKITLAPGLFQFPAVPKIRLAPGLFQICKERNTHQDISHDGFVCQCVSLQQIQALWASFEALAHSYWTQNTCYCFCGSMQTSYIGFSLHKDSMEDVPENLDDESSIDENAVKISQHISFKFGKGNSVKIPASLLVKDWVHTDMA